MFRLSLWILAAVALSFTPRAITIWRTTHAESTPDHASHPFPPLQRSHPFPRLPR